MRPYTIRIAVDIEDLDATLSFKVNAKDSREAKHIFEQALEKLLRPLLDSISETGPEVPPVREPSAPDLL